VDSEQVAGTRAYDEGKTAVLAGLAAGAGILLSQGPSVFASAATWIWGVALPMTLVGTLTHYLTALQAAWARFWQRSEQQRCADQSRAASADVYVHGLVGAMASGVPSGVPSHGGMHLQQITTLNAHSRFYASAQAALYVGGRLDTHYLHLGPCFAGHAVVCGLVRI
jgi:hypothetical protein